jgi:hypothetical protein
MVHWYRKRSFVQANSKKIKVFFGKLLSKCAKVRK